MKKAEDNREIGKIKELAEEFNKLIKKVFGTGKSVQQELRSRVDGKYYLRTISPTKGQNGKVKLATVISKDISKLKEIENELKQQTQDLEIKSQNLEKLNTALEVLLKKVKEDRKQVEKQVIANVEQLVKPALQKMRKSSLDKNQEVLVDILESNIEKIVSPFASTLSSKHLRFIPSEIRPYRYEGYRVGWQVQPSARFASRIPQSGHCVARGRGS